MGLYQDLDRLYDQIDALYKKLAKYDSSVAAMLSGITLTRMGIDNIIDAIKALNNLNNSAKSSLYLPFRDGQLMQTQSMTPAQAFYSIAMLPGWQKWMPTYRYGTITELDGDVATVELNETTSTPQTIDVNQAIELYDVPIEYMNCNGAAFNVNDEVIVQFMFQDFDNPKVIGFKESPKSCCFGIYIIAGDPEERIEYENLEGDLETGAITSDAGGTGTVLAFDDTYLYGNFIGCDGSLDELFDYVSEVLTAASGATMDTVGGIDNYYGRSYEARKYARKDDGSYELNEPTNRLLNTVSAFDKSPMSNINTVWRPDVHSISGWWSKTYDEMIVTAYTYHGSGFSYLRTWTISVSYQNKLINYSFPWFQRDYEYALLQGRPMHIGFDIWRDDEGTYCIGLCGDWERKLYVFEFDEYNSTFNSKFGYYRFTGGVHRSNWRVGGYGFDVDSKEHRIYSFAPGARLINWYLQSSDQTGYFYERIDEDGVLIDKTFVNVLDEIQEGAENDVTIDSCVWDPVNKQPYFIVTAHDIVQSESGSLSDNNMSGGSAYYGEFFQYVVTYDDSGSPLTWPNVFGEEPPTVTHGSQHETTTNGLILEDYPVVVFYAQWPDGQPALSAIWTTTSATITEQQVTKVGLFGVTNSNIFFDKGTFTKDVTLEVEASAATTRSSELGGYELTRPNGLATSICTPTAANDYDLTGAVFTPNNVCIEYETGAYESVEIESTYKEKTQCRVLTTTTATAGDSNFAPYVDDQFPHDTYWKSILMGGEMLDCSSEDRLIEIKPSVIYKNKNTGNLDVYDGDGNFIDSIEADRGFFKWLR